MKKQAICLSEKTITNKYDNDALAEVCAKFDLLEYASQFYEFRRTGSDSYACSCPLHFDKTPSLVISPSRNRFYCFSCGVQGSPIDWCNKIEKLPFNEAVNKIVRLTGSDTEHLKSCEAVAYFKTVKRMKAKSGPKVITREVLPYSYYEQFVIETPQEWLSEGISSEVMREYDIRIDKRTNRITYPIYDNVGNLVSVKGRTRFKDYKDLGIAKYQFYNKISTTNFLVGLPYNKEEILKSNSVIIFEGIKSGLKLTTYNGQKNWVAAETSCLTEDQIIILISMGIKDITIAFDQDVKLDKIKRAANKLSRFTNVYAIQDKHGLLKEKDSPVDEGLDIFNKLMEERIRI